MSFHHCFRSHLASAVETRHNQGNPGERKEGETGHGEKETGGGQPATGRVGEANEQKKSRERVSFRKTLSYKSTRLDRAPPFLASRQIRDRARSGGRPHHICTTSADSGPLVTRISRPRKTEREGGRDGGTVKSGEGGSGERCRMCPLLFWIFVSGIESNECVDTSARRARIPLLSPAINTPSPKVSIVSLSLSVHDNSRF